MEDKKKNENKNPEINLIRAMIGFQKNLKSIHMNKTVNNGRFSFNYADYEGIWEAIQPLLVENELWFTQSVETIEGDDYLISTLTHIDGASIRSKLKIRFIGAEIKNFGAAITYYRRYAIQAIFCVSCTQDKKDEPEKNPEDEPIKEEPKKIEKLSPDQIGEINDMLSTDEWPIFKKSLEVKGYKSLGDVEASKFKGLKVFIESIKPNKVESINAY